MKKWVAIIAMVLVIGFVAGGAVATYTGASPLDNLVTENTNMVQAASDKTNLQTNSIAVTKPMGVADMVQKVSPAVVNIESQVKVRSSNSDPFLNDPFFRQFFGDRLEIAPRDQYKKGIGTGFIISQDGYIITNQHVIDNAEKVTVTLNGNKDSVPARVVGQDYELDLAVLKIDGKGYPTIPMGNSDQMRVGDGVVAIGQPYGLDHTVTTGVVSAKGRPITIEDRNYKNLIQTDAAINPGNSGGPLLNMSGQVIAINTAVNTQAQGIGFAIPINTAQQVLKELMNGQKVIRPYMGIRMTDMNENVAQQLNIPSSTKGVVVVEVISQSPAAKAGLKYLDIITQLDGKTVTSGTEVQTIVEQKKVGDRLTVKVIRQGKQVTIPVILQAKP